MSNIIEDYLNVRTATTPSFSPDGRRLGFISNLTGVPQPWTVSARSGWPQPVSLVAQRSLRVAYAPHAPLIAFDRDDGGNERWQISPINHVEKVQAPLMVLHGAKDPRVSISLAEELVRRLREREVPAEYLRFEDEGHGFVRLANRLVAYPAIADFLDRHLRG